MFMKSVATALLGSVFLIMPAMAQTSGGSMSRSDSQEINASTTGQWQASQLINLNVYNDQNEKIGDIKELMMDKSGKIDQVVVGVGGVLGIGERDVAIKFSELKFSDQPVPSSSALSNRATTGAGSSASSHEKNYPDHAILNMTKDQLKSMPQFNYNK